MNFEVIFYLFWDISWEWSLENHFFVVVGTVGSLNHQTIENIYRKSEINSMERNRVKLRSMQLNWLILELTDFKIGLFQQPMIRGHPCFWKKFILKGSGDSNWNSWQINLYSMALKTVSYQLMHLLFPLFLFFVALS